ncbi:MAG: alanine--tRNA ligase [Candidatus Omnitrophica bacterium CG11_big_fil_rev_8_21_14_0_20_63_9]|nr:MAG: alanine--tRNA ligase [Candidatus Omnitrophica bacterium CG11_big_fil_rev_8_21_14_0_20_63_9]
MFGMFLMHSADIRERFLKFFEACGHTRVPSDSLIPSGDPTVLFTSAGMNQFKDCFLGKRTDMARAASSQKCLRTGDLDRVGTSASHHSFFEMLGNFSFGDYFKPEAIQWAWEFLTGTCDYAGRKASDKRAHSLSLPADRLWVSVYEEDKEAAALWQKLGVPPERIKRFGQADNFWPANAPKEGPNGPCGPCSEIYYDPEGQVHGPKSVEVWNLVFTQFDRQSDGSLKPLPRKNIDTGMGLERLSRVIQDKETDYETDLFEPILDVIRRFAKAKKVNASDPNVLIAQRRAADHIRAIVFLISEGLLPSNEKQGYVLRMLIRRTAMAIERGMGIGFHGNELISAALDLAESVEMAMGQSPYAKALYAKHELVRQVLSRELMQFQETVAVAVDRLTSLVAQLHRANQKTISGEEAFRLYDTYGLPFELTQDLANEKGLTIDRPGFEKALKIQQQRSRAASQFTGGVFVSDELPVRREIAGLPSKEALFIGYDRLEGETTLKGLWDGTTWVQQAKAGQAVGLVLERSPFYGEAGGQIGDTGMIEAPKGLAEVERTSWVDDVLIHQATVRQGTLSVNEPVRARVDAQRRLKVARSHTATHLLHWALRKVLGPDAVQAGSYVDVDRVRFDFSSLAGLKEEQREEVESLVNQRVRLVDEVHTDQMRLEEAKHAGAVALFGEKYGGTVRVVTIGDYSKELCGGTHVLHTGFVGGLVLVGESSIAAGTRRVEALVGDAAADHQQQQRRWLQEAAKRLSRPPHEVIAGLEELLEQIKRLDRERKSLQLELAKIHASRLVAEGKRINGITLVTSIIRQTDRETLVALADAIRQSLQREGVVLLASSEGPAQVSLVMATTSDLTKRIHAGELLKAVSPLTKGSGGGRPEFAQAGGKDPAGIPAAMKRAEELVREALETSR